MSLKPGTPVVSSRRGPQAEKAILVLAGLSLLATVTNVVPLSAVLVLPALVTPLLLVGRRRISTLTFSLVVLLGYFLIWTVAYSPISLLEYGFYRRDGNVFITFAPLLLLPLLRPSIDLDRFVRVFLYFSAALNGGFLVIYALTGGTILFYEEGIYHFLFHAHNAAGGFLAVTTALSLAYYLETRERLFLLLTIGNLIGLVATVSRGSILGLLGAIFLVLVLRGRFTKTIVTGIVVVHLIAIPWLHTTAPQVALNSEHPALVDAGAFDALPRSHTIAIRVYYLWPRAWGLFLASPIIGTGFGSFNDLPYRLEGTEPIFQVNRVIQPVYNDSHAHHTFLHVLAETGILGLLLLIYFLVQIARFLISVPNPALRVGLQLCFWIAVLSSLTEHRLFTPSQMLPFTIILGLAAGQRWGDTGGEQRTTGVVPGEIGVEGAGHAHNRG